MDIDKLLDIEKRTGVKDKDISNFLEKVDDVQEKLRKLMSGELKPEDIKIPGQKTEQELKDEEEERALRARERAERKAKEKREARERWWRGAELRKEHMQERSEQKLVVEIDAEDGSKVQFPRPKQKGKDCLDYSVWERWIPDDPVSLQEMKEKVDEVEKKKDEQFEAANKEFCDNFKKDMEDREKSRLRKETDAQRAKEKGNRYFKKRDYNSALTCYKEALDLLPYAQPVLTNIAQVYIKKKEYDEAIEFCNRALFLKENNVKALSRRALCARRQQRYEDAVQDLELANKMEPLNEILQKELRRARMERDEHSDEQSVIAEVAKKSEPAAPEKPKENEAFVIPDEFSMIDTTVEKLQKAIDDASSEAIEEAATTLRMITPIIDGSKKAQVYVKTSGASGAILRVLLPSLAIDEDGGESLPEAVVTHKKLRNALLQALAPACGNRQVQLEFLKRGGLAAVAALLGSSVQRRGGGGSDDTVDIDLESALATTKVLEACLAHDASRKKLFGKTGASIFAPLVDIIHISDNPQAVKSACEVLSIAALSATPETAVELLHRCSQRGMNAVETLTGIIGKTDTSASVKESATRALANFARHPQWRPFLCGYNSVPSLVKLLRASQDESIRANVLAILINGAVAQEGTAAEVYTEVRKQLYESGAIAPLIAAIGDKGRDNVVRERSAALLSRIALHKYSCTMLRGATIFKRLVDGIGDGGQRVIQRHLIRAVAICIHGASSE
eukprot:g1422.t1